VTLPKLKSDLTSVADLPSIEVPSTLKKSLSATPDVNIGIFVSLIPKDNVVCTPASAAV